MRISYRTHPVLQKLAEGNLGKMPIDERDIPFFDMAMPFFRDTWKYYLNKFKEDVNILTNPFAEAVKKAAPKLTELYRSMVDGENEQDVDMSCTNIIGNTVFMFHQSFKKGSQDITTILYCFTKEGLPFAFYIDNENNHQVTWISKAFKIGRNEDAAKDYIMTKVIEATLIPLFKKYADVETKELPAKQKIKGIDCKYINETMVNLTYLDSKWFTTLTKSDAFTVRGHFRMQPKKKNGEWTKELIWINDFEKLGYTAPARKLNQINTI